MQDFEYQDDREQAEYDEQMDMVALFPKEGVDETILEKRDRKWKNRRTEQNIMEHQKHQRGLK